MFIFSRGIRVNDGSCLLNVRSLQDLPISLHFTFPPLLSSFRTKLLTGFWWSISIWKWKTDGETDSFYNYDKATLRRGQPLRVYRLVDLISSASRRQAITLTNNGFRADRYFEDLCLRVTFWKFWLTLSELQ